MSTFPPSVSPCGQPNARRLADELSALVARAGFTPRQSSAVVRRLGWDGEPPATLRTAGAPLGYTRERVRQLEQRLIAVCDAARVPLRETAAALAWLHAAAPVSADTAVLRLGVAPGAILRAATMTGVEPKVALVARVVHRREEVDLAARATRLAAAQARARGAICLPDLAASLGAAEDRLCRLLLVDGRFVVVDDSWLLEPLATTPLSNAILTVIGVARRLHLDELALALERTRHRLTIPEHVVRAICDRLPDVRVAGNQLIATEVLDLARLAPVERTVIEAFRTYGPLLRAREIADYCAHRGLRRSSVSVYLGRSPICRPVAHGTYALVGFDAELVEIAAGRSHFVPTQQAVSG